MRYVIAILFLCATVAAKDAATAAALVGKGEFEKGADVARSLVENDPTNVDAWLVLADALVGTGEPHDAWSAVENGLAANPKDPRLTIKLGDVFLKVAEKEQTSGSDGTTIRNLYMDAVRMYREAFALDPKSAAALYGQAIANFNLGGDSAERMAAARKAITDCLALDPKYAKAHALQAFMFYNDGNQLRRDGNEAAALEKFRAAEEKYKVALDLDPSDPIDFVRYGHCFYAQGKTEDAKRAYIDALVHHPSNSVAIVSGLFYVGGRDWRKLAPILQEAATKAPKSGPVWYYLGYSHYTNQAYLDALEALGKAEKLMPPSADLYFFMGSCHEYRNDADKALEFYRKALRVDGAHDRSIARFEALTLQHASDIGKAEKMYDELLDLAPSNGWVRNNYALLLRDWAERRGAAKDKNPSADVKRRIKRSAEVYEQAAALLPEEAQVQSDTGLMFEYYPSVFDASKARRYFIDALELSDYVYRDAFDGLNRLCRRTADWETLRDYAESVVGAIERGKQAIAPLGGKPPAASPNETPGLMARAQAAFAEARSHVKD